MKVIYALDNEDVTPICRGKIIIIHKETNDSYTGYLPGEEKNRGRGFNKNTKGINYFVYDVNPKWIKLLGDE